MRVIKLKASQKACLAGVALVVIGVFLPWAKWPSWGDYLAGSVLGIGVVDERIFLALGIVAGVSSLKSLSATRIGLLRLFPGLILLLGGLMNADVFWGLQNLCHGKWWNVGRAVI